MLTIKRSPAKVCWHVMFNNSVLTTANTRQQAEAIVVDLNNKYGGILQ